MKVLLNRYEDPRLSECIYVGKGDKVFATRGAKEYGFTHGKEYEIHDVDVFGHLVMKNDKGEIDTYSVEFFTKYRPLV